MGWCVGIEIEFLYALTYNWPDPLIPYEAFFALKLQIAICGLVAKGSCLCKFANSNIYKEFVI